MVWLEDWSRELCDLLVHEGYNIETFHECLSDAPIDKKDLLVAMNKFLANNGSKRLKVSAVKDSDGEYYMWLFDIV
jgi:hypothetical protein